jgi:hypothetical protein
LHTHHHYCFWISQSHFLLFASFLFSFSCNIEKLPFFYVK